MGDVANDEDERSPIGRDKRERSPIEDIDHNKKPRQLGAFQSGIHFVPSPFCSAPPQHNPDDPDDANNGQDSPFAASEQQTEILGDSYDPCSSSLLPVSASASGAPVSSVSLQLLLRQLRSIHNAVPSDASIPSHSSDPEMESNPDEYVPDFHRPDSSFTSFTKEEKHKLDPEQEDTYSYNYHASFDDSESLWQDSSSSPSSSSAALEVPSPLSSFSALPPLRSSSRVIRNEEIDIPLERDDIYIANQRRIAREAEEERKKHPIVSQTADMSFLDATAAMSSAASIRRKQIEDEQLAKLSSSSSSLKIPPKKTQPDANNGLSFQELQSKQWEALSAQEKMRAIGFCLNKLSKTLAEHMLMYWEDPMKKLQIQVAARKNGGVAAIPTAAELLVAGTTENVCAEGLRLVGGDEALNLSKPLAAKHEPLAAVALLSRQKYLQALIEHVEEVVRLDLKRHWPSFQVGAFVAQTIVKPPNGRPVPKKPLTMSEAFRKNVILHCIVREYAIYRYAATKNSETTYQSSMVSALSRLRQEKKKEAPAPK